MTTGRLILSSDEGRVHQFIRGSGMKFYVYLLHRPDGPFYVGKGTGNRFACHLAEARNTANLNYRLNIIRKMIDEAQDLIYEIDSLFLTEHEAFERERSLIRLLGRYDLGLGPLANMTDGGEGLSCPSEETKQKQRACWSGTEGDSDYALINRFFYQFVPGSEAVPIKPFSKFQSRLQPLSPHPESRHVMRVRQCSALLASVVAHRILLAPGSKIPRRLTYNGTEYVIENGAGRDILKSGVAMLSTCSKPRDEIFEMTGEGLNAIIDHFGRARLESWGVLMPG